MNRPAMNRSRVRQNAGEPEAELTYLQGEMTCLTRVLANAATLGPHPGGLSTRVLANAATSGRHPGGLSTRVLANAAT